MIHKIQDKLLPFRIYEHDALLTVPEDASEPLIEDFLFHHDLVMLIAEDKMGKTIFSMQMAMNLSSGTPFLGIFDIPKAVPVWYFAHEGKDDQLIDRIIRMQHGVSLDTSKFKLFCGAKFRWNDPDCKQAIALILDEFKDELPKVIFVDPLYAASKGDLNNNEHIKEFIHILRVVGEVCGAAIIVVHHMKKKQRNDKGEYHSRNDTDAYGSATMKWAVDHMFWIDKYHHKDPKNIPKEAKEDRFLKCDTQRGGNISANIRLRLVQPDPLRFIQVDKYVDEKKKVIKLLKVYKRGLNITQLMDKSGMGRTAQYIILRQLMEEGVAEKDESTKIKYYKIKTA